MRETWVVAWLTTIDTESVSDAGSSNVVLAVTLALIVLGIGLLGVTVWFWRATRPDPEALGPLVAMSDRGFATLGPIERRRVLDGARPVQIPNQVAPVTDDDGPVVDDDGSVSEPDVAVDSDTDVVVDSEFLEDEADLFLEPDPAPDVDDVPDVEDIPDIGDVEFDDRSGVDDEPSTRRPIDPLL